MWVVKGYLVVWGLLGYLVVFSTSPHILYIPNKAFGIRLAFKGSHHSLSMTSPYH